MEFFGVVFTCWKEVLYFKVSSKELRKFIETTYKNPKCCRPDDAPPNPHVRAQREVGLHAKERGRTLVISAHTLLSHVQPPDLRGNDSAV